MIAPLLKFVNRRLPDFRLNKNIPSDMHGDLDFVRRLDHPIFIQAKGPCIGHCNKIIPQRVRLWRGKPEIYADDLFCIPCKRNVDSRSRNVEQQRISVKQKELLEEKERKKKELERAEKELASVDAQIDKRFGSQYGIISKDDSEEEGELIDITDEVKKS